MIAAHLSVALLTVTVVEGAPASEQSTVIGVLPQSAKALIVPSIPAEETTMTLKYHYSPNSGAWTRCVAQSQEACPFGGEDHGDRTSIANHHHGGVLQDSAARESTVTPVIAGVYAVFTADQHARTYTAKGNLIPAADRARYFKKLIAPKLAVEQPAEVDEDDLGSALNRQLRQIVLPPIEFSEGSDGVVVRRSAPLPADSPPSGGTAPRSPAPRLTPQQVAKMNAQRKKAKAQRRKQAIRNCRHALRAFKAYNRQVGKVAKVGGSSSSKGQSVVLNGFLDWFIDLFELD